MVTSRTLTALAVYVLRFCLSASRKAKIFELIFPYNWLRVL